MAGKPGQGTGGQAVGALGGLATARKKRKQKESARAEVEAVYSFLQKLKIDGHHPYSLEEWAKSGKNLTEFYVKLWGKLVPNEVTGGGGGPILIQLKEL